MNATAMRKANGTISFTAQLQRPRKPKAAAWSFLVLPQAASDELGTRSMVSVEGTIGEAGFQATLEPDGAGSHWLKVGKALREQAGALAGDTVQLQIVRAATEPEPKVPADLKRALDTHTLAKTTWKDITPLARRDWIAWIVSGQKAETRVKRIAVAVDKLAKGDRRACCFDRSGMVSRGNRGAPESAD